MPTLSIWLCERGGFGVSEVATLLLCERIEQLNKVVDLAAEWFATIDGGRHKDIAAKLRRMREGRK